MDAKQFRFVFSARDFERSVSFYEEKLGMKRIDGWDRPDSRGALLSAGGNGVVEILGAPRGTTYDGPSPIGAFLAIEIDEVDAWYGRLVRAEAEVAGPPQDQYWGHRSFTVRDPDGVSITLYSVIDTR